MATDSSSGDGIEATSSEIPSGDEGVRTPATPIGSDGNGQTQREPDLSLATAQDLVSRVLDFLSTASNETLGACLVGLGAATYFVFGRIGLILIGAVGGVVLHATWEGGVGESADGAARAREARRRREIALDVAERVLDWREKKQGDRIGVRDEVELKAGAIKPADFSGFAPETAAALNGLTDAVIRDYVKCVLPKALRLLTVCLFDPFAGGGMARYFRQNCLSQALAARRLRHSSFRSLHTYRGSVQPTPSLNLSRTRPLS
jgi:hypothetical protein